MVKLKKKTPKTHRSPNIDFDKWERVNLTETAKYNSLVKAMIDEIDYVPPSARLSSGAAELYVFEDNEAVIKMCIKGRSPTLRYVPRTHRVDLDWLFERIKYDPGVNLKYVGTGEQLADLLTKASFTIAKWNILLKLHQIGIFEKKQNRTAPPVQSLRSAKTQKRRHKLVKSALLAQSNTTLSVASRPPPGFFSSAFYIFACRCPKDRQVLNDREKD